MMRVVRNYLICAVVCFGLGACFSIAAAHFLKKEPNEIIREKAPDLYSSDPIVRLDAVKEISRMGTEALPFLLKLADSHDEKEREMAVHVLGEIGAVISEDILPVLYDSLKDKSARVRESAALSILRCGPAVAQRAIPDILKASAGTSIGWSGKREIRNVLHNMGPPALEDIPAIKHFLKDEHASVRLMAVCVLSDLGPRAQPALDSLLEALKDEHSDVRVAACRALGWKGNVAAVPHLEYVAKNDEKERVRKYAKWALETIGGGTEGQTRYSKKNDSHSLHKAVEIGDENRVKALISNQIDVNSKNARGDTPLHIAAMHEHRGIVRLLLANGANVNAKNNQGYTPLHRVLYKDIAALLVAGGADVNAKRGAGWTPLHIAVGSEHGRVEVEGLGLSTDVKAKILAKDSARRKALLCFFIEKGADVNAKDNGGSTPLHAAASAGHKEDVEFLIANGAKLNSQDCFGLTPLDEAVMSGHKDIAKILREKTVSAEKSGQDEK